MTIDNYFNLLQTSKNYRNINNNTLLGKLKRRQIDILKKNVVKIFSKSENKKFRSMNSLMKFLNKTKIYYLKKDLDLMVDLENYILRTFNSLNLINSSIKGIEFPINIRIVHPSKPIKFKSKYDTGSIHCDPWAGEPEDLVNVVIYLNVKKDTPKINIFETSQENLSKFKLKNRFYKNKFFLNTKEYFKIHKILRLMKSKKLNHTNGNFFIFNCFVPHNSIRTGKNVRLSLEFRLRTKNPYNNLNYWLNKTNRRGRYWLLPNKRTKSFHERFLNEIKNLKRQKGSKKKISMRKKEIKRFLIK